MIICFIGPSASGKTETMKMLESNHLNQIERVITNTTRFPRVKEIPGKSYYFLSNEEFLKRFQHGDIIEMNEYPPGSSQYYGMSRLEFDRIISSGKTPVVIVDWKGYEKLCDVFGKTNVKSIFFYRKIKDIRRSLILRGEEEPVIRKRLSYAVTELSNASYADRMVTGKSITELYLSVEIILMSYGVLRKGCLL